MCCQLIKFDLLLIRFIAYCSIWLIIEFHGMVFFFKFCWQLNFNQVFQWMNWIEEVQVASIRITPLRISSSDRLTTAFELILWRIELHSEALSPTNNNINIQLQSAKETNNSNNNQIGAKFKKMASLFFVRMMLKKWS